jgi:hypothetical protein
MAPVALVAASLALLLAVPAGAAADGLPVPGGVQSNPLLTSDGKFSLATLPARGGTNVARIEADGGGVRRSRLLPGRFVIPAVALDGTSSGLSANGSRLVLIRPRARFPQSETRLAILDARTLRTERVVTLNGDFSFDAISPDGSRLYLIHYLSGKDPTQYAVRAYDPRSGRMSKPIVDPREPGEDMSGFPVTRATSPDGRMAYTLYDNAHHPFVHALDTERGSARCIDLPEELAGFLRRQQPSQVDLAVAADGGTLEVVEGGTTRAVVDTKTLEVSEPAATPAEPAPGDGGGPWPLVGFAAVVLALGCALAVLLRRRRRPAGAAIS